MPCRECHLRQSRRPSIQVAPVVSFKASICAPRNVGGLYSCPSSSNINFASSTNAGLLPNRPNVVGSVISCVTLKFGCVSVPVDKSGCHVYGPYVSTKADHVNSATSNNSLIGTNGIISITIGQERTSKCPQRYLTNPSP